MRASAANSCIVRTGSAALTTRVLTAWNTTVIGEKSLTELNDKLREKGYLKEDKESPAGEMEKQS